MYLLEGILLAYRNATNFRKRSEEYKMAKGSADHLIDDLNNLDKDNKKWK